MPHPKLMVPASALVGAEGRPLPDQDLTAAAVAWMADPAWDFPPDDPRELILFLSAEARAAAEEGSLVLGPYAGLEEFRAAVARGGGPEALWSHLGDVAVAMVAARAATELLGQVSRASFRTAGRDEPVYEPVGCAYYACGRELVEDWAGVPVAPSGGRKPPRALVDAIRLTDPPPFGFSTRPVRWPGVSARQIREEFADVGTVDAAAIVASSLEDHHEDAIDRVVDLPILCARVEAWVEAGAGDGLEGFVESWNAVQSVTSMLPDRGLVLGLSSPVTKAGAVEWCRGQLAFLEDAAEAVAGTWPRGA